MTGIKFTTAAFALLLTSAMGYADDATKTQVQPTAQKSADCPAVGTVPEAKLSAECKQQLGVKSSTAPLPGKDLSTAASAASAPAPASNSTVKTESVSAATADHNAVLASQFMGQTVYSSTNQNVGEINDLVMNKDLNNILAVIGVGGFLGIGEKDVAIPIDQLTATKDTNNKLHLTIVATKEQLEAAPAFDRTALK